MTFPMALTAASALDLPSLRTYDVIAYCPAHSAASPVRYLKGILRFERDTQKGAPVTAYTTAMLQAVQNLAKFSVRFPGSDRSPVFGH